ncbi:MAG TPA: transposase [Caulobacteraceae bacterium]|jgi:transposase
MGSMVVLAGPERRRRWSADQKRAILAAADEPRAVVSEVARRADICTSLIYRWRRERREAAGFVPAMLVDDPPVEATGPGTGSVAIVVELTGGARVSIGASAPAALVTAALRALR